MGKDERVKTEKGSSPKTVAVHTETPVVTSESGTQASLHGNRGGSDAVCTEHIIEANTSKLLKALHVFRRYSDYTGQKLPDEVELFGMSLLGQITVSGFNDRLEKSVRTASCYLDAIFWGLLPLGRTL